MSAFEHMPDFAFRMMSGIMALEDFIHPRIDQRVAGFGIGENMTVVDYGCGPGRYTIRFARLVGAHGRVFAVDVQPLAIKTVQEKAKKQGLGNIVPVLARGYDTGLPDQTVDAVCALDMFFGVSEPTTLLSEIRRIIKDDGFLIIDDGHQPRRETLRKIKEAGMWRVVEETRDHLKCLPIK